VTAGPNETAGRETVLMVTTSYPRFPGDTIGTFMEPIARGLAARGHAVHVVLPWHPRLARPEMEHGVFFHPYRYAPIRSLNVFGYAGALSEDVRLRRSAWAVAPLALVAGWRAARVVGRRVRHRHPRALGRSAAPSRRGRRPSPAAGHQPARVRRLRCRRRHAVARRRPRGVSACELGHGLHEDLRTRTRTRRRPIAARRCLRVDARRFA
jgi:hypothetical protein